MFSMSSLSLIQTIGLLALFSVSSSAQEAFPEGVTKRYDRFSDSTTVTFRLQLDGKPLDGLMLEADYVYKGTTSAVKNPLQVSLVAISPVLKDDFYQDQDEMLILILDGRRERFPLVVGPSSHMAGLRIKSMVAAEFRDFFTPMVKAASVEGRVGIIEFKLKPEQIEMLRSFVEKHNQEYKLRPSLNEN